MPTSVIVLFLAFSVFYGSLLLQLQVASASQLHDLSQIERRLWRRNTPLAVAVCSMPLIGRVNSWVFLVCSGLWFGWLNALLLFGGSLVVPVVVMSLVRPLVGVSVPATISLIAMPAFAVAAWVALLSG